MAFILKQLSAIDAAIASGQLKLVLDGKQVEYRNMDELLKARQIIVSDLTASGLLGPSRLSNRGPASLSVFSRD